MRHCLPCNINILISQVKRHSPGNGVDHCAFTNTGSSCKCRRPVPDIDLIYRTDFLLETITQFNCKLVKDRKYPE